MNIPGNKILRFIIAIMLIINNLNLYMMNTDINGWSLIVYYICFFITSKALNSSEYLIPVYLLCFHIILNITILFYPFFIPNVSMFFKQFIPTFLLCCPCQVTSQFGKFFQGMIQ